MELLTHLYRWFWDPNFWLPPGITYENISRYANSADLWSYPFVLALLAIIVRQYILNRCVFYYIGIALGISEDCDPNLTNCLERIPNSKCNQSSSLCLTTSKDRDLSLREVSHMVSRRMSQVTVTRFDKFQDSMWLLFYHFSSFIYGIYVITNKPWFLDIKRCWTGHPHHPITSDVWWYYMLSLGFYWSMIITHFLRPRINQFWTLLFHHFLAVILITLSWTFNFVRIGTLILLLLDFADIPLHGAKICNYAKAKTLSKAFAAILLPTWIYSRVYIYSFKILKTALFDVTNIFPWCPSYYIFATLLIGLFVIQLLWTFSILNNVKKLKSEDEIKTVAVQPTYLNIYVHAARKYLKGLLKQFLRECISTT